VAASRVICQCYTGGFTATNGYLLQTATGVLLVDAPEGVAEWLDSLAIKPDALLLTHQHFDHVMEAGKLQAAGVPIYAWADYSPALTLEDQARAWGLPIAVEPYRVDKVLAGHGHLALIGLQFALLPVPGHSPDSVVFFLAEKSLALVGDTLFAGSIGRTDLPHGEHATLLDGIRRHLLTLAESTEVLSGHGAATTIAAERRSNPFLSSGSPGSGPTPLADN
jgi:hydroxyacylglutathione hydrolase